MANLGNGGPTGLVVVGHERGRALIATGSPLTRLNYFDGKLLRAEDLRTEQNYLRKLAQLSNQAGGAGPVHGLGLSLPGGDRLGLSAGMAVDGGGRVLLLPEDAEVGIADLLERSEEGSASAPSPSGSSHFGECELQDPFSTAEGLPSRELFLLVLSHAEALCGEEDVYGRLCDEACVTATDRPYRVEGVLLRALPLSLESPLPTTNSVVLARHHLRSRVAAAWFEGERRGAGSLVSGTGLAAGTWCRGAGREEWGHVPLGVLARQGDTTLFLDAWTARRERMDAPPRRYWTGRLAMRPWNVFLAQLLQFQCHLAEVLGGSGEGDAGGDPCDEEREALEEARRIIERLKGGDEAAGAPHGFPAGQWEAFMKLDRTVLQALDSSAATARDRILVRRGIVELPPAGYLPVASGSSVSVNRQVRRLLGEGVDLRFCSVRPDFVAHALEEAVHMDRISLLEGLDDASVRPEVDILVPDGQMEARPGARNLFDVTLELTLPTEASVRLERGFVRNLDTKHADEGLLARKALSESSGATVRGTARTRRIEEGGGILHWAGSPGPVDWRVVRYVTTLLERLFQPRPKGGKTVYEMKETRGAFEEAPDSGGGFRIDARQVRIPEEVEVGLWASLRHEADLARARPGDRIPCHLEGAVGIQHDDDRGTARLTAEGTLVVGNVSQDPDGGRRTVAGRFPQIVLVARSTTNGEPGPVVSHALSLHAEIEMGGVEGGARDLRVRLTHASGVRVTIRGVQQERSVEGDLRAAAELVMDPPSRVGVSSTTESRNDILVRGTVRSLQDGSPLPGAQVTIGQHGTTADASGGFQLSVPPQEGTGHAVNVSFLGMKPVSQLLDLSHPGRVYDLDVRLAPQGGWTEETQIRPLRVQAEETDAVLDTDHPARRRAVEGLEIIGRGLDDPSFRPGAEAKLFPERPDEPEAVIHATRDWVLFHRRRTKLCAPRPPRVETRRDRRYRLYHVRLEEGDPEALANLENATQFLDRGQMMEALELLNEVRSRRGADPVATDSEEEIRRLIEEERALHEGADLEELREALRSDDPAHLERFSLSEVDTVAFRGDGVSLTSPEDRLRDGWRRVEPGDPIVYGGLAGRDEAATDGAVLAEARVDRLQGELEPETPTSPEVVVEVLPHVPAGLSTTATHGVVVLATRGRPEDETDRDCFDLYRRTVARHRWEEEFEMAQGQEAQGEPDLLTAEFEGGSTDLVTDPAELSHAWNAGGGGTIHQVWTRHAAPGSIHFQQAMKVADLMGFAPEGMEIVMRTPFRGPCREAELVVLSDVHRLLLLDHDGQFGSADTLADIIQETGLVHPELGELIPVLEEVAFDGQTGDLLTNPVEIQRAWLDASARFQDVGFQMLSVATQATPEEDAEIYAEQSRVLGEVMGLGANAFTARTPDGQGFGDAAAVTLVLPIVS